MSKQIEIEIPKQNVKKTTKCYCREGELIVVPLAPSVSPDYLFGECPFCKKKHFVKN